MPCAGAHAGQPDAASQSSRRWYLDAEFLHLHGDKQTKTPAVSARYHAPTGARTLAGLLR